MPCTKIHAELLSPAGMRRIRVAIIQEFPFLIHRTSRISLLSIAENGLQPNFPGADFKADMECVHESLGVQYPPILCLTIPNVLPIKPGVELAIDSAKLPKRLGVDWSFNPWWQMVDNQHQTNPHGSIEQIFLCVFCQLRSLVVYDPIPASDLRIRTRPSSANPTSWPMLKALANYDEVFVGK